MITSIRYVVTFVRYSPQRLTKFRECVKFLKFDCKNYCVFMFAQGGIPHI